MAYKLKSTVHVAVDPDAGGDPNEMSEIPAGTPLSEVGDFAKAQLSPDHFADDDGKTPKDWRSKEAQAADERQAVEMETHRRDATGEGSF